MSCMLVYNISQTLHAFLTQTLAGILDEGTARRSHNLFFCLSTKVPHASSLIEHCVFCTMKEYCFSKMSTPMKDTFAIITVGDLYSNKQLFDIFI